jgi:hypothetical protein
MRSLAWLIVADLAALFVWLGIMIGMHPACHSS